MALTRRPTLPTLTGMLLTALVMGVHVTPTSTAPGASFMAVADAAWRGGQDEGATVWGTITRYTDNHVIVDGKRYNLARNVVIDTYSLKNDRRGNVRLTLDASQRVTQMFFYGIDMPEVVRRYKM